MQKRNKMFISTDDPKRMKIWRFSHTHLLNGCHNDKYIALVLESFWLDKQNLHEDFAYKQDSVGTFGVKNISGWEI